MKTKNFFFSVFAMVTMLFASNASAQENADDFKKNEFQLGVNYGARDYSKKTFGTYAEHNIKDATTDYLTEFGLSFVYLRNLNKHFAFGPELKIDWSYGRLEMNHNHVGDMIQGNIAAMAVGRYYWLNGEHFGLYSKLGLGLEAKSKKIVLKDDFQKRQNVKDEDLEGETKAGLAVDVTPVGVDFGGKRLRGFVETNIGNAFTLTGGVKYSF